MTAKSAAGDPAITRQQAQLALPAEREIRVRVARVITEATSPAISATAALVAVGISDARRSADAVWVSLAAVLIVAVPMAFILLGVHRGRWSDHHVGDRESRTVPLIVAVGGVSAAAVLLSLTGASRVVLAVVIAMLLGVLVVLAVSRVWKISIHCAVAGGLLAVLVTVYGPWWLLGLPAIAAVAWSRVALDDHTALQTIVGAVVGGAVAATVFPLLS